MDGILYPSVIVLLASLLQSGTGFGFSIMATPFLLFFFPPQAAIQLNIILSIAISVFLMPKVGQEVDRVLVMRLIKGSIPGAVVGISIFLALNLQMLKLSLSLIILGLTVLLILRLRIAASPGRDIVAGTLAGLLTTSLGMPGVPLLLYFSSTDLDKATLRSTTLAFFLFIYLVALLMQVLVGSTGADIWITSLKLLPALIVGMLLGQALFHRINQETFRTLTYLILLATGTYLLTSAL